MHITADKLFDPSVARGYADMVFERSLTLPPWLSSRERRRRQAEHKAHADKMRHILLRLANERERRAA